MEYTEKFMRVSRAGGELSLDGVSASVHEDKVTVLGKELSYNEAESLSILLTEALKDIFLAQSSARLSKMGICDQLQHLQKLYGNAAF